MIFSYFKENKLNLKRPVILAISLLSVLSLWSQDYNNIEFIENKGQWDSRVKFKGDVNAGAFFLRSGGFTVLQHNPQDLAALEQAWHGHQHGASAKTGTMVLRSHAWNVDFLGADPAMEIAPDKGISTYNNYFLGNDPSKWASGCRIFQAVTLRNVYPNIDVRYYTNNGALKYDIIIRPGGNVSKIALQYEGVDKLQVKNKELVVATSIGERKESAPYTYQSTAKGRTEVDCRYKVTGNIVRFEVKDYDPSSTLIIDPTMVFCSFTGSTADNWGYTATYGPDGSMFGGGIVRNGNGFPASPGAFQTTYQGGNTGTQEGPCDIGIIKLSPTGNARVYATYIGGTGNEQPHSLIVDNQGNLVMAGRSNSGNYPTTGTGQIGAGGSFDIVVTKFNPTGTALLGSKKIGGASNDGVNITPGRGGVNSLQQNYGDDGRSEVIIDGGGNIYVASCTQSSTDFPVTAGAFQGTYGGGTQDGALMKFTSALNPLFISYLGGSSNDAAYVLSLGANGNIFVGGGTESANFPGNHTGTIGPSINGNIDGFVAEISNNGSNIIRSTFIGTGGIDQVFGIQFDRNGFPYIMGQTTGTWVAQNATFSSPGGKQFIGKLRPDLSGYVYTTMFGTNSSVPNISPVAFLVDRCENVYVSGWGGLINPGLPGLYPNAGTTGMPVTSDALDPSTDGADMYFFVLARDATSQLYGSFFGQTGGLVDHVDGGTSRFDQNGVIYQGICANCNRGATFPTTAGVWGPTNGSQQCNMAMVKIAFNLSGVGSDVESAIGGVPRDTAGCVPLTVDFTDQIRNAQSYIWDFGDGSPQVGPLPAATGFTQTHTYNAVGTYQVMLIAIDPATCNIRDTSYIHIRVGDLRANVDFNAVKIGPCTSFQYQFNNLSVAPPSTPFQPTSFTWDFGDGSPTVVAGLNSVTHTYAAPGTYNVILRLTDTSYCNSPDADTLQLSVDENVDARFTTPATGCVPYTAIFDNTSIAGQTWQWDFGDGNTSTAFEPTHLYTTPGTYNVVLVATNPNTCNITDTARFTITVVAIPTSNFSYTPTTPVENTPNFFTNLSSPDAVRFKWLFGDGDSLVTTSRAVVQHQYNATGTFTACLIAYNAAGCPDTSCQDVQTRVVPVVDVPNAFTPQSGDVNSKIFVRGFGISKMRFIIWNRWGQKVFETGNRLEGWDGKFKGQLQPMDVYAYTLDVEFFDGAKTTRKGDITLIR
jgi:gliding motility-associated-like protein